MYRLSTASLLAFTYYYYSTHSYTHYYCCYYCCSVLLLSVAAVAAAYVDTGRHRSRMHACMHALVTK